MSESDGRFSPALDPPWAEPAAPLGGPFRAGPFRRGPFGGRPIKERSTRWYVGWFLVTFVTTTMAGAIHAGVDPFSRPWAMGAGLSFSVPLLAILLAHEFGHFFAAKYHHVGVTPPLFIPAPPLLVGTFGAFIRLRGMPRTRRALFDVGAAGPWAGFFVALPVVVAGLRLSHVKPLEQIAGRGGLELGTSVLFDWLSRLVLGVDPDKVTILLHPTALAGWFGLFVTFLNLLPVGQLDGGHVVYALFGRRHQRIARVFLAVIFAMGFLGWQGWWLWCFLLLFVVKVDHPDTMDADTPLDPTRRMLAWATIAVFALTFMPVPLTAPQEVDDEAVVESPSRDPSRPPSAPLPRVPSPGGRPAPQAPGLQPVHHLVTPTHDPAATRRRPA
ncbi:MAG: site-2 protease family protein [Alphaproteobacteria bacterium]